MKEEASLKLYEAILTQTQRWMVNVAQRPKFVQVSTILPSSSSSSSSSLSSSVRGQRENESCVTTHGTRVSLVNTSTSKSIEVVRLDLEKDPVLGFRLHHPMGETMSLPVTVAPGGKFSFTVRCDHSTEKNQVRPLKRVRITLRCLGKSRDYFFEHCVSMDTHAGNPPWGGTGHHKPIKYILCFIYLFCDMPNGYVAILE